MGKHLQLNKTKNVDNTDYFIIFIYEHTEVWACVRECTCVLLFNNRPVKRRF